MSENELKEYALFYIEEAGIYRDFEEYLKDKGFTKEEIDGTWEGIDEKNYNS